jgi:trehalose-6-phosphate synthase
MESGICTGPDLEPDAMGAAGPLIPLPFIPLPTPLLKNARNDLVVAQFWHIPWPNREVFRICPWQEEILDGLLGNDLLAFHIPSVSDQHRP